MLYEKKLNSHFEYWYFAYGILRILSTSFSIRNNFWRNSAHAQQIFKIQKRVIRIMSGMGPRYSCRNLFKKLNILTVPSQYILSLMLFIIENQQDFFTSAYVHALDTRNKNHLYLPALSSHLCTKRSLILRDQNL